MAPNTSVAPEHDAHERGQSEHEGTARHRVQLEFSPAAFQQLQELRRLTDARSHAEVVRNALRVYAWFVSEQANNKRILVRSEDGKVQEVVKFFF
jgi:hypothetical protein